METLAERCRKAAGYNGAAVGERQALLAAAADALEAALPAPSGAKAVAIAEAMRDKHSSPTGDEYSCGGWDMAQRIIGKLRKAEDTHPLPAEVGRVLEQVESALVKHSEFFSEADYDPLIDAVRDLLSKTGRK